MDEDRRRVLDPPFVTRAARWGVVVWATIGALLLAFFAFRYVVYPIRIIFPPLVIAMIAVYLLNPVVSQLERRGFRRGWAALVVYLVGAAIVGTALFFLVPLIAEQVGLFIENLPRILRRVTDALQGVLQRFGADTASEPIAPPTPESIEAFFSRFFSIAQTIVEVALIFALGPILAFYFLVDLPKIKRGLRAMIPARRRAEVESVLQKIGEAIGGFFRGQLLVALFVGLASSLALLIVGLPFWAVVGMVAGLFNLIPLVGPFIGGAVAVFIALTTHEPAGGLLSLQPGWPLALGSAVALLIVQQIDNHILSPNIVGRTVRLHPVTVMLGLLVGAALLGLWGMLLAIPAIATIKILILHAWDTRVTWPPEEEQEAFGQPPPAPAPTPAPGSTPTEPAPEAATQSGGWAAAMRRIFGPPKQRPQRTSDPGARARTGSS